MSLSRKTSLQTFVVLLRGINVGSTRKVPMADLRAICLKLGWTRPETYIQSGNLIVEARGDAPQVRRALEPELAARFGFAVDVVVRTAPNWETYVAANPFANDAAVLDKMVHLYASRDPLASRRGRRAQGTRPRWRAHPHCRRRTLDRLRHPRCRRLQIHPIVDRQGVRIPDNGPQLEHRTENPRHAGGRATKLDAAANVRTASFVDDAEVDWRRLP